MRRSLTKKDILRKKQDIDRVFRSGRKATGRGMRLLMAENGLTYDRFIVIPAKHYGNAVERNLVRRRLKEVFRLWPGRLMSGENEAADGRDIALVVYPGKVSDYASLESDFNWLSDRLVRK